MLKNTKKLMLFSLALVIFADSVSWGIVFSTFANLILNSGSHLLNEGINLTSRTAIYELLFLISMLGCFTQSVIIIALGRIIAGAAAGSISVAQLGGILDHLNILKYPGFHYSLQGNNEFLLQR